MDVASVLSGITSVQTALQVIQVLHLTSYFYYRQSEVQERSTYDFIIIGGGTAGCVVTRRLVDTGNYSVLLIEAGSDPPFESEIPATVKYLPKTRVDWNYTSRNDDIVGRYHKQNVFDITRGKMLGGSSGINYMAHVQANAHDFDSWAEEMNDTSWSYENMRQYFIKSERLEDRDILNSVHAPLHGNNGPIGLTRQTHEVSQKYLNAFAELGNRVDSDINANSSIGFMEPTLAISGGFRQSMARTYLAPVKENENLHILKNTLATQVVFDGNKAIGVKVLTEDGQELTLLASNEVILSAGSLNTPQLLMLSGIGPREHLESLDINVIQDLPVGQNLQDHLGVLLAFKMEQTDKPLIPEAPSQFPLPVFFGFSTTNTSQDYPDYMTENFIIPHDTPASAFLCSFFLGFTDDICQRILSASEGHEVLLTVLGLLHPKSRGQVLLQSSDPKDAPLIYPGYFSDEDDLEKLTEYVLDFLRVMNTTFFNAVGAEFIDYDILECENNTKGTKEYWRCYSFYLVSSMYRFSCSCPMGTVVDSELKVLGVEKLRLVDASVMPTIPGANTNANVVVLAEKGADIIIKDYF